MQNIFGKFENFGLICDSKQRKKISSSIFDRLAYGEVDKTIADADTENFSTAINSIIENNLLKNATLGNPQLSEKITQEILDFVNRAKKEIATTENSFESEKEMIQVFSNSSIPEFNKIWPHTSTFLKENYNRNQIDCGFFDKEFSKVFVNNKRKVIERSFTGIRDHLSEKWQGLLLNKITAWELAIIDKWRIKTANELYKRIEEFNLLKELLEPFSNELGRLFDLSNGNWTKTNFDVLNKYADFLSKDKEIKKLAEMLGRFRIAEKEYEDDLYSKIVIKPNWQIEHAGKSDLIGIKESDDLSSMLPSEAALLSDELLHSIFIKKYAEKKLQTFEYQAKVRSYITEKTVEKKQIEKESAKGPFIICVDTSGSMHGTPEHLAKTLCFAILKLAVRDNRKCYLISFSTKIQMINVTDLKNSIDKTIEFLSMSFHGGTDADPALKESLNLLSTQGYKKADVVLISDFVMNTMSDQVKILIDQQKEMGTKFHSLVIGECGNKKAMTDFDNNWFYDSDNPNGIVTLVQNIRQEF